MSFFDSQMQNIQAAANNVLHYATEVGSVAQSVTAAANQAKSTVNSVGAAAKPANVNGILTTFGNAAQSTGEAAQATKYVMWAILIGGGIAVIYFLRKR